MSKGQSFFEVVVALAVIAVVLITLVALATVSIRNSTFSRNKTLATRFTQDALEWLRAERGESFSLFAGKAGGENNPMVWCVDTTPPDWPTTFGSCDANQSVGDTIFTREVKLTNIDASTVQAEVTSSWSDSQGVHQVTSTTDLTKWQ